MTARRLVLLSSEANVASDEEESPPPRHGVVGHYLYPGELFASAEPTSVTTILGTCVAVCLWDPEREVGGMNHYLLPYVVGAGHSSPRFGSVAIGQLIDRVVALGARRAELRAKVFGGMTSRMNARRDGTDLGTGNVLLARRLLGEAGISIVAEDVGGEKGRKLVFRVRDGTAWVRQL